MSFEEELFKLINSKNTIKRFFYGFLILLSIDILTTLFILTFFPATTEKNFLARFFISEFGNFWGLIISIPFEFANLGIIFIICYVFFYIIIRSLKSRTEKWPNIYYLSLIIVLFIAILLHLNGVFNNLSLLVRLIFGF
jgi:hypothetical protein